MFRANWNELDAGVVRNCVTAKQICDGVQDCSGKSDEIDYCSKSTIGVFIAIVGLCTICTYYNTRGGIMLYIALMEQYTINNTSQISYCI